MPIYLTTAFQDALFQKAPPNIHFFLLQEWPLGYVWYLHASYCTQKLWNTGTLCTVIYSKCVWKLIGDALHQWTSKLPIFYRLQYKVRLNRVTACQESSPVSQKKMFAWSISAAPSLNKNMYIWISSIWNKSFHNHLFKTYSA